jgi:hypothetical protein
MVHYQDSKGLQAPEEDSDSGTSAQSIPTQSSLSLSNVIRLRPHDTMMVETRLVNNLIFISSRLMDSSVISVPGYHTPPVRSWGVKNELEKAAISVDSVSHLHMYIHQPVYDPPDNFSWETFLKAGSDLAEDLARLSTEVL